jgi:hypothetical protein
MMMHGGGHATLRTYLSEIRRVRLVGRLLAPEPKEFRFCVGPVNDILLWEGADHEHHFRVHGQKTIKATQVNFPNRRVEVVVEQSGLDTATVTVNGVPPLSARTRLQGLLTVYTAASVIAVDEIQIEGIPDPQRQVQAVPVDELL